MTANSNKHLLLTLGLSLSAVFLVNCQRARLEPNNKPAPQVQGQGGEVIPPAPAPQVPVKSPEVPRDRLPTKPKDGPKVHEGDTCTAKAVSGKRPVKVLFVIDSSGSNHGANGSTPSDPDKSWRIETIRNFITSHVNNKNFYFGMTLFKGTTSKSLINPQGEPGFSNDRPTVAAGFKTFLNTPDGGNTPYRAALRKAKGIIAADLEDHKNDGTTYAVVMVSDGHATDYKSVNDVIPDASAIKDLAPDRITLNSVYYSAVKVDAKAPQYLKTIARIGEGQFILANTKKQLELNDKIVFASLSCQ